MVADTVQLHTLVTLSAEDRHHARTLKLKKNDPVFVVDQQGIEYQGEIRVINHQQVEIYIKNNTNRQSESSLRITLFQGLAKGSKLEMVVQKCTELGVTQIVPMITAYSQIKIHPEREQKRHRWQEIARQASRQSGRLKVPHIESPVPFEDCLEMCRKEELSIILHNGGDQPAHTWDYFVKARDHVSFKQINLFVGPEGGFHPQEIEKAGARAWPIISLGPRILRAETAGMVAVTLAQMTWGDLGRMSH